MNYPHDKCAYKINPINKIHDKLAESVHVFSRAAVLLEGAKLFNSPPHQSLLIYIFLVSDFVTGIEEKQIPSKCS